MYLLAKPVTDSPEEGDVSYAYHTLLGNNIEITEQPGLKL
jgi:hypothetical protein